ncbi:hypothetical protein HMPREF9999_01499 [Alloprevotella sp. oral taxon 473 str. F0040]|nr:hypothetical protein HMPREF9999_01499 [Alloprevotella sp. oral taxon 473 str. F0040]
MQTLSFYLVRQLRPSLSSSMYHFALSLSNSPLSFLFFCLPRARVQQFLTFCFHNLHRIHCNLLISSDLSVY